VEHAAEPGTILALMEALEASWFGTQVRTSTWIYPAASVLHVLGVAFLLGVIAVYDLRLLGGLRQLPIEPLGAYLPPIAGTALGVQVVTGFTMFAADADHVYDNPYFLIKLGLIVLALANIAFFYWCRRNDPLFFIRGHPPAWAKASGLVSLLAWIGVASFGRMIAYI
jgi:hypothetical protein